MPAHIKHRNIEIIIINNIKEKRCRIFLGHPPCMRRANGTLKREFKTNQTRRWSRRKPNCYGWRNKTKQQQKSTQHRGILFP
jgi:hypothetical protein